MESAQLSTVAATGIPPLIIELIAKLSEGAKFQARAKHALSEFARRELKARAHDTAEHADVVKKVSDLVANHAIKLIDGQLIEKGVVQLVIDGKTFSMSTVFRDDAVVYVPQHFSESSKSRARDLLRNPPFDLAAIKQWNAKHVACLKSTVRSANAKAKAAHDIIDVSDDTNDPTPHVAPTTPPCKEAITEERTPARHSVLRAVGALPRHASFASFEMKLAEERRLAADKVAVIEKQQLHELNESRKLAQGRWFEIIGTVQGVTLRAKFLQLSDAHNEKLKELLMRLDKWSNTKDGKSYILARSCNTRELETADLRCKQLPFGFHASSMGQIVDATRQYSFSPGELPWLAGAKAEDTIAALKMGGVKLEDIKLNKRFKSKVRPVSRDCVFMQEWTVDLHQWLLDVFGPGPASLPTGFSWIGERYNSGQATFSAGAGAHLMLHTDTNNAGDEEIPSECESMSVSYYTDERDYFNSGLALKDDNDGETFPGPGCLIAPLNQWPHRVEAPLHGKRVSISLYMNADMLRSAKLDALPVALKTATTRTEAEAVEREFKRALGKCIALARTPHCT